MNLSILFCETMKSRPNFIRIKELKAAWNDLKEKKPQIFNRDAASLLDCSEGELIALECGEKNVRLNVSDKVNFLNGLKAFGEFFWILRNDVSVLEVNGTIDFKEEKNVIHGCGDLCLIACEKSLVHFFVCRKEKFLKRSVQVFNAKGVAVFKAFLCDEAKIDDFDKWIVDNFIADNQSQEMEMQEAVASDASKHSCVKHAENDATTIPADSFKRILEAAVASEETIQLVVGNHDACQGIKTSIKTVKGMPPWFNIMDDRLHMHIREDEIKRGVASKCAEKNESVFSFRDRNDIPVLRIVVPVDGSVAGVIEN